MGSVVIPTEQQIEDVLVKYGAKRSKTMTKEIKNISVALLKPHPKNELIYGFDEDVTVLKDQIQAFGKIVDALKIKEDHTIISGHRRVKAAKELGLITVPCEFVSFDSDEEELAALVLYNYKRTKTNEQKAREGIVLYETLSIEAVKRKLATLKQYRVDMDDSSTTGEANETDAPDDANIPDISNEPELGLTRDKVAQIVGLRSGRTFDRMRDVLVKIDDLRDNGKTDDSELYVAVLNRSPSAAKDLIDVPLESLTDEDRENIRNGKVSPRRFLQKHKPSEKSKNRKPYIKISDEIKSINRSVKTMEKSIPSMVDDFEQQVPIHESLEATINKLRDLRRSVPIHDKYDDYIDVSNIHQSVVSALTESIRASEYDDYLEACKDYAEKQIKNLKELLSVIEAGMAVRDAPEEHEKQKEVIPTSQKIEKQEKTDKKQK